MSAVLEIRCACYCRVSMLDELTAYRIDDEDDEMVVNDQAVERLVIVTQVGSIVFLLFIF
jgi:hypothetical protein